MIKKFIFLVGLVVIIAFGWFYFRNKNSDEANFPKQEALQVSQHSDVFHQSFDNMMNAYYEMTETFVNWDSSSVQLKSESFKSSLGELNMDDMNTDSIIYQAALVFQGKTNVQTDKLINGKTLAEKRAALNLLTPILYDFLRIVKYDNAKVYLMECPMAFNDVESGFWLNKTNDVRNPYLGISHPKYNKTMLACGLAKDTLNFMPQGSASN